jgi:hypothetical protein
MTISGTIALWHEPPAVQALAHLGYPAYFGYILGTAKLLGVFVLLTPGRGPIKEWTYAGFGIILISACISHYVSGDGFASLDPFFFFILLVLSYGTRPAGQRLIPAAPVQSAGEPEGAR